MSKRKPFEPVQVLQNENIQITNEPIKHRSRAKSSGAQMSIRNAIEPEVYLNDNEYTEYWNQYEMTENLQKALNETNEMNMKIEQEISRLSNVENELKDQIQLNQQLYDLYMKYRNEES